MTTAASLDFSCVIEIGVRRDLFEYLERIRATRLPWLLKIRCVVEIEAWVFEEDWWGFDGMKRGGARVFVLGLSS